MDGSAREAARSATGKPDDEDDEDEDADAAKVGRGSKMAELLGPFCSRGEKASKGGSYRWTCPVCSTDSRPSILSGSSSKVLTHFRTFGHILTQYRTNTEADIILSHRAWERQGG